MESGVKPPHSKMNGKRRQAAALQNGTAIVSNSFCRFDPGQIAETYVF